MKYIINNHDYSNEVNSLTDFAQERLGFSDRPKILFDDDTPNSQKTLGKTGYYDPNTTEVHIYASGRHIKDILRSLAHEFVHHMQNEKGELTHDGYMGQGYAQKNPKMREMERQAYEMGNLCFRDWEDSLKEKHPTIYNERRNRKMSLKDWKNKELNENLNKKWGFKMNLNEGFGAGVMDPMGGQSSMEMAPPMDQSEVRVEQCIEEKVMMGMSACEARPVCEKEMGLPMAKEQPSAPIDPGMPFQEAKDNVEENLDNLKGGLKDYMKGKSSKSDDSSDDDSDKEEESSDEEKSKDGKMPMKTDTKDADNDGDTKDKVPAFVKESLNRKIRVKIRK